MYCILGRSFVFFSFNTLNILCQSLLSCKVSAEKSAGSLMGVPLYITSCFFFFRAVFKISPCLLTLDPLFMCFVVNLFGYICVLSK